MNNKHIELQKSIKRSDLHNHLNNDQTSRLSMIITAGGDDTYNSWYENMEKDFEQTKKIVKEYKID